MDFGPAVDGSTLAGFALGEAFVPSAEMVQLSDRWQGSVDFAGERLTAEITTCGHTLEKVALRARYDANPVAVTPAAGPPPVARATSFVAAAMTALAADGYVEESRSGKIGGGESLVIVVKKEQPRTILATCGAAACDVWVVAKAANVLCIRDPKP